MISLSVVMPAIIILSILLLVFAAIIMLLAVALVQRRKRRHSQPTAIPKILEKRAIVSNVYDSKRRPKSTNLEFLHSTTDSRYNTGNTDSECCRPLVDTNHHGNEYVQCWAATHHRQMSILIYKTYTHWFCYVFLMLRLNSQYYVLNVVLLHNCMIWCKLLHQMLCY